MRPRLIVICILVSIALIAAGCDANALPQVTPTVAPTDTPTATQQSTEVAQIPTRTPLPTATTTGTPTATVQPSETATATETGTPTPTATPSNTDEPTATPSDTPSATFTLTPTPTFTATPTPTATDTNAPTATLTFTPTPTFTATFTLTPTQTPTPTETPEPSVTPLPLIVPTDTPTPSPTTTPTLTPSATFTATSTETPEPTATQTFTPTNTEIPPTPTPQPTLTPTSTETPLPPPTETSTATDEPTLTSTATQTPNLTATAIALATDTPSAPPTFTPFPEPTDTATLAPTQNVTPTIVTAAPGTDVPDEVVATLTPLQGGDDVDIFLPTATPQVTSAPTVANVTPPPTVALSSIPTPLPLDITGSRGFALGPGGGVPFDLGGGVNDPTLFVRNPVNPNSYLVTNTIGLLYTIDNGNATRPLSSPFLSFDPPSRSENKAAVSDAAWSPNGSAIAFVVDTSGNDPSQRSADDGVWYYLPGQTSPTQLLRACPVGFDFEQTICSVVQRDTPPYQYRAVSVVWSPQSDAILTRIEAFDSNRTAISVLVPGVTNPNFRAPAFFYDYGDWTVDGRLVISGRDPNGRVVLGTMNRDGSAVNIVLDGSARGLWLQNGTQRPDGQLVALGRPGDANGPMQIYTQTGTALTGNIGGAPPVDVKWSPDRSQVYVQTADGRKYLAGINGAVTDITAQVGGIQAVAWVQGALPPSSGSAPADYIPPGVIEDSRFQPGQQVQVVTNDIINIRANPRVETANAVGRAVNGEIVAILAGPVNNGGVEWWQVQTTSGLQGWMAGRIGNAPTLIALP